MDLGLVVVIVTFMVCVTVVIVTGLKPFYDYLKNKGARDERSADMRLHYLTMTNEANISFYTQLCELHKQYPDMPFNTAGWPVTPVDLEGAN